jgi:F1F0 ATPase subunit 2
MAVIEALALVLAGLAGVILGTLYFGGLWWTVCNGLSSPRPALWFAGSLVLRMSVVLAGLYLVSAGRWQRLLVCLAGFVVARLMVTNLTRPPRGEPGPAAREAGHAP